MSDTDTDFREDVKRVVRRHDPGPETLRAVAEDLEVLADRFEATDDVL
jgi:hypothetical protein